MGDERQDDEKPDEPIPESRSPVLDFILDTILPDRPGAAERRRKDRESIERAKDKPN
jgi:hypothetical protein